MKFYWESIFMRKVVMSGNVTKRIEIPFAGEECKWRK